MIKYIFAISLAILLLVSCNSDNYQYLDSVDFGNKEERIKELNKIVTYHTDVLDVEFELFNVNGFGDSRTLLPGTSSWNYYFLLKVNPEDLDTWKSAIQYPEDESVIPNYEILDRLKNKRKGNWELYSNPILFSGRNTNSYMLIYEEEGLIFRTDYVD